jgi:Protein of unknown function (DUF2274)
VAQPVRRADRPSLAHCPAGDRHPTRLPGPGHRQSGPDALSLRGLKVRTMAKLKLGAIGDLGPVRFTIELPARQRECVAYAEVPARETAQGTMEPTQTDRADACSLHGERARLCQGEGDHFRRWGLAADSARRGSLGCSQAPDFGCPAANARNRRYGRVRRRRAARDRSHRGNWRQRRPRSAR